MFSTKIRPVTDLRNKYSDVEKDLSNGPVVLTKNGYGASVLLSIDMYDRLIQRLKFMSQIQKIKIFIHVCPLSIPRFFE